MPTILQLPSPPSEAAPFDELSLVRAFASFTEAASSLERSYSHLQSEVTRLRRELAETNRDLARSLTENQRMHQHLNRILAGLPCGVLVTEPDDSVSIANPEARRLLGTLAGAPLGALEQVPVWLRDLLDDAVTSPGEHEHACRGGSLEWISLRHTRLDAAAGASSIFILRDISEAKRLEEAQDTLRRRQALAEMSALLAHEVRNPLASLELFAGLLVKSRLKAGAGRWAEQLQSGLRTLAATVNNVLQFHGQPPPDLSPTDLGHLLASFAEFLAPLAEQAKVRLELAHQLDGVLVASDEHRLEQVFLNLALNAFRFMPGEGVLRITGGVRAGRRRVAHIELGDTGSGIAAEQLGHIFEPGFTTRPGSPGLGLAVCKNIIELHGGSIGVTSRIGVGSTFHLEFPLLEAKR
jgi:two-component system sensor histidine kinase FlrB